MRIITLSIVLFALLNGCAQPTAPLPTVPCQKVIDDLFLLNKSIDEHCSGRDFFKDTIHFDVNQYFSILNHLSIQEGYVLDYIYQKDSMYGAPHIYARLKNKEPYRTYEEYESKQYKSHGSGYLEHIKIDNTQEGYFQFIVLHVMGGQFYRFWHAQYNDSIIICDIEKFLANPYLPTDVLQRQARKFKVEPVVELNNDIATVKVVVFTKWGGFLRRTYKINRKFPHTILAMDTETLVPYSYFIMY